MNDGIIQQFGKSLLSQSKMLANGKNTLVNSFEHCPKLCHDGRLEHQEVTRRMEKARPNI